MEGMIIDVDGSIVHFVLPSGAHRPAIIVRVCHQKTGVCNLQVFTDGANDGPAYEKGIVWETSVKYSEEKTPNTWHWIEKA